MSTRARIVRIAPIAAIAAGGLLAGHFVDYALLFPVEEQRGHVLEATGHGYWPPVVLAAAFAAGFGLLSGAASGFLAGRTGGSPLRGRSIALLLATLQAGGFVALEFAERLASGAALVDLAGPVLGLGVFLQFVVASVGTLVLRSIYRLAAAAGTRRRRRIPDPGTSLGSRSDEAFVATVLRLCPPVRAPPFLVPR